MIDSLTGGHCRGHLCVFVLKRYMECTTERAASSASEDPMSRENLSLPQEVPLDGTLGKRRYDRLPRTIGRDILSAGIS
jgi:hypothetical protein